MSKTEFDEWANFYQSFPFDDKHRYHRPAALIAKVSSTAKIDDLIAWLQPSYAANQDNFDEADMRTLAAFGFKPPARK